MLKRKKKNQSIFQIFSHQWNRANSNEAKLDLVSELLNCLSTATAMMSFQPIGNDKEEITQDFQDHCEDTFEYFSEAFSDYMDIFLLDDTDLDSDTDNILISGEQSNAT